jgi:hypothetical protein
MVKGPTHRRFAIDDESVALTRASLSCLGQPLGSPVLRERLNFKIKGYRRLPAWV